ncbi:MAG TPA: AI-2E family transporter [Solirubrobacteraceae bacterium]|nr:AI-2E family transporter [Solirubrobacteraceae bacterium]
MSGVEEQTRPDAAAPPDAEERELAGEQSPPGPEPARVLVPRWVQLVLLPLALLGTWALARAAGKVFLIFVVAALIALILNPAVAFLQRSRLPRGVAVFAVYLGFFLTVAGVGVLLANPISNQVQAFTQDVPHIVTDANKKIVSFQGYLNRHGVHVKLVKQGKTALQTLQEKVVKGSSSVVSFGGDLLTQAVSASFDLVLVFVLSVYMLIYGESIGALVRRVMPNGDGSRSDDYPALVQRAVSHYVQGQLLFSFIMGATAGIALYVYGLLGIFPQGSKYAIVFAVFFGLMELIPYVGPILGAAPPIIVALFTDPIVALWVALLFVVLQQLEGHIVAPQIFGHSLRINPLLVILALLLGQQLYGLIGALVALPILSILRETVVYLSRHLELEPWERSPGGML